MRLARWIGCGMATAMLMGCGNRYGSLNYATPPGYAQPVRAASPVAAVTLPSVDIGRPSAMTFDKVGNLMVANAMGNSLMSVTSRGEAMEKADNLPDPAAVTTSRSGAVYVACHRDGSIVRVTTSDVKRVALDLPSAKGLAVASDETLYVTLPATREIVEIKSDGTRRTIWHHATWIPEQLTMTAKDELFVSVRTGATGRLLQIDRNGRQLDQFNFEDPITGLAANDQGRLLVAAASPDTDGILVGELGWLDRNGQWSIVAEDVVRPMAVTVYPGGNPVYVHYDEARHRYEIVSIVGNVAAPWLTSAS